MAQKNSLQSNNDQNTLDAIKQYLTSFASLSNEDWVFFKSKLKKVCYPKKTVFLKQGSIENHLSFIEDGIVRLYIPKN